jgi:hypothetical protein
MAAKKAKKSTTFDAARITEDYAARIVDTVERMGRRVGSPSGARAFGVSGLGFDWSDIGENWEESQIVAMAADADVPAASLDRRRIVVIPIIGEVTIDGKAASVGSSREFPAGAEVAFANGGDDTAAFIVLTQKVAKPHADNSNGDETDDKLIPVVDVGKHRSDGAGEAETGEEE